MRTTLNIHAGFLEKARELSGITEKTALVRAGLEALIARETGKRLAMFCGTQPKLSDVPPICMMVLADTSVWIAH